MSEKIVEIVTFTLIPGADPEAFAALAGAAVAAFLAGRPGCLGRSLSVGSDGRWCDHVLWASMAAAEAAAAALPASPDCAPFLAMIDGASLVLRHERLRARWPDPAAGSCGRP